MCVCACAAGARVMFMVMGEPSNGNALRNNVE